jgi:hypothetical protein
MSNFMCKYCGLCVKTRGGLRQHIDRKPSCFAKQRQELGFPNDPTNPFSLLGDEFGNPGLSKKRKESLCSFGITDDGMAKKRKDCSMSSIAQAQITLLKKLLSQGDDRKETLQISMEMSRTGTVDDINSGSVESEDELSFFHEEEEELEGAPPLTEGENGDNNEHLIGKDYNNDRTINMNPNTEMRDRFKEYCRKGSKFTPGFSKVQARAIRLMGILHKKRAPLGTYDHIMEWFHREKGDIQERETLMHVVNTDDYISRKCLLQFLRHRYNLTNKMPRNVTLNLPNSKAKVTLTMHSAWHCIESLLTDPRVNDDDYNFHNNDPLAPPHQLERSVSYTQQRRTRKRMTVSSSFLAVKFFCR